MSGETQTVVRSPWIVAGPTVLLAIVILLAIFHTTVLSMVTIWWTNGTYGHCLLILPIVAWLAHERWPEARRLIPRPDLRGLVLLAGAALAWLAGNAASVQVVEHFALVGMIQALVFTLLGWPVTRAFLFPLFYLVFAIPFGEFLVPALQDFTAYFVVKALVFFGVPVFSDGVFLSIPEADFVIAEACSGIRFLIATLAIAALFANLSYKSWRRRAAFMALAVVVPVVANVFRALGIVMIARWSNAKYAVGADHIVYGWIFLAIVTLILLSLGMTFADRKITDAPDIGKAPPGGRAPLTKELARSMIMAGLLALVTVGAAPAYGAFTARAAQETQGDLALAATAAPPWRVLPDQGKGKENWQPVFHGAAAEKLVQYENAGKRVDLYIGYFTRQTQGHEVVSMDNRAFNEPWRRADGGGAQIILNGHKQSVISVRLVRGLRNRLVYYWYWVDGRFTASPQIAKLLYAKARLIGGVQPAAVIAIASDFPDKRREGARILEDFAARLAPLQPLLHRVHGGG